MPRRRKNKRALRPLAASFTVAAPTGARIRDRLRVTTEEPRFCGASVSISGTTNGPTSPSACRSAG
ncbi:hypothetical protein E4K10_41400 [Streptomyces sp. T1317-0309]|nr:hypothetical protein E4K10_41400 [Streptomyces sp. T1317-0309]